MKKNAFAEHVTATAFSLTLSRNMAEMLALHALLTCGKRDRLDELDYARLYGYPHSAESALERRGLLKRTKKARGNYELTEAGCLLLPLLALAGLIPRDEFFFDLGRQQMKRIEDNVKSIGQRGRPKRSRQHRS